MDEFVYFLVYAIYISISSAIAYPLLKCKCQSPKSVSSAIDMVFFNCLILGLLPILPLLMKYPPKNTMSLAENYEYHEKKKIWIWNK